MKNNSTKLLILFQITKYIVIFIICIILEQFRQVRPTATLTPNDIHAAGAYSFSVMVPTHRQMVFKQLILRKGHTSTQTSPFSL